MAGIGTDSIRPIEIKHKQRNCERRKEIWKDFEICGEEEIEGNEAPQGDFEKGNGGRRNATSKIRK